MPAGSNPATTTTTTTTTTTAAASIQALMLESVDRSSAHEAGSTRGVGAGTDSYYEVRRGEC